MNTSAFKLRVVGCLACCLSLPYPLVSAFGLRDQALAYRQEGYQQQQHGDLDAALASYEKAVEFDPAYATARVDVGVVLEQMGRPQDAQGAYESALVVDPDCLEAHSNLASLYEQLGQPEQAIAHWRKRYELGDAQDPWTVKAEERLAALGALKGFPGPKGLWFVRHKVVQHELEAHEQSLQDYRSLTEQGREW